MNVLPFFVAKVRLGDLPHWRRAKQRFKLVSWSFIRSGRTSSHHRANKVTDIGKENLPARVLNLTDRNRCTRAAQSTLVHQQGCR